MGEQVRGRLPGVPSPQVGPPTGWESSLFRIGVTSSYPTTFLRYHLLPGESRALWPCSMPKSRRHLMHERLALPGFWRAGV